METNVDDVDAHIAEHFIVVLESAHRFIDADIGMQEGNKTRTVGVLVENVLHANITLNADVQVAEREAEITLAVVFLGRIQLVALCVSVKEICATQVLR